MSDERTLDLLEAKIEELRKLDEVDGMDLGKEISRLEKKLEDLRRELYASLGDWERVRLARHPKRPYALDYIDEVCDGFYELHGDRIAGDDRALLAGLAQFDGRRVVVLAQQKGRSTEENKEKAKKARDAFNKKYRAYRSFVDEKDAFKVGAGAEEAFKSAGSQGSEND